MEYGKLQKAERRAEQQEVNLTGIPAQMKWDLEARSGLSLDDVRVHYHSDKPAGLGALAYTQGTQVHIGPGQEGHLRHELGHVVQQKLGLVRPNARIPGGPALNTEEALERQADAIGAGQTVLSAAMPPVQRCEAPVVQAAGRITNISGPFPDAGAVKLANAKIPTIVFEAMGVGGKECEAVYEQTKRYPGNTICVFGLNAKTSVKKEDFTAAKDAVNALAAGRHSQGADGYCHLLYTFSFQWKEIEEDNKGYPLPFVEARVLVMHAAAGIVEKLTEGADAPDMPPQYTFLYRWIDADARDDTTASLTQTPDLLDCFARMSSAAVVTGRYDWRSQDTGGSMKYYKAFLKEFNQAERELRDNWYTLKQSKPASASGESSGGGAKKTLSEEIKSREYLPGYYFPESALMMNQSAHDIIVAALPAAGALKRVDVSENSAQDKESMRMVSLLDKPRIAYRPELSVTKPLKGEFAAGTYWGDEMLGFLREKKRLSAGDEARFIVALKNVRQSAFNPGNWYFIKNDDWNRWETARAPADTDITETRQELFNQKRRDLKTRLFSYLTDDITIIVNGTTEKKTTRWQLIAGEIPPPPAQS